MLVVNPQEPHMCPGQLPHISCDYSVAPYVNTGEHAAWISIRFSANAVCCFLAYLSSFSIFHGQTTHQVNFKLSWCIHYWFFKPGFLILWILAVIPIHKKYAIYFCCPITYIPAFQPHTKTQYSSWIINRYWFWCLLLAIIRVSIAIYCFLLNPWYAKKYFWAFLPIAKIRLFGVTTMGLEAHLGEWSATHWGWSSIL